MSMMDSSVLNVADRKQKKLQSGDRAQAMFDEAKEAHPASKVHTRFSSIAYLIWTSLKIQGIIFIKVILKKFSQSLTSLFLLNTNLT